MRTSNGKWEMLMDAHRKEGHKWMAYAHVQIDGEWVWRITDYKTGAVLALVRGDFGEAQTAMDELRQARRAAEVE